MVTTPTYNFELINFDKTPWSSKEHDNWRMVDAILANFIPSSSIQGVWSNSLAVTVGQRYVDPDLGTIWSALVAHTSAASGTFATDRAANTSYWEGFTVTFINQGTWAAAQSYTVNDFVVAGDATGSAVGIVVASHTSATSYATGVADGNIVTLVDLSDEVAATAADVVSTNADVVSTNADVVLTNADVVTTTADAATTTADVATTTADAASTAADVVSTNADVVSTNADVVTTNANAATTTQDAIDTAADAVSTAADAVSTAADAAALPTISGGDAQKMLAVNAGETGYDFDSPATVLANIGAQAAGDVLTDLNTLGANAADSEFLVGTGAGALAWESGSTVLASLGLDNHDSIIVNSNGIQTNPTQSLVLGLADAAANVTGDDTIFVPQWSEIKDQNGDFDDANTCTAEVAGTYDITYSIQVNGVTSGHIGFCIIAVVTSNRTYTVERFLPWGGVADSSGTFSVSGSVAVDMDAADTFTGFTFRVNTSTKVVDLNGTSYFSWRMAA